MKTRRTGKAVEIYTFCSRQAASTMRNACKAERKRIRRKLRNENMQDRQWWSTLKRIGGDGRAGDVPTIIHNDGSEASIRKEKADVFGKFFASKCSLGRKDFTDGKFPSVRPRTRARLSRIRFREKEVRKRLKKLDVSKANGPDGISERVLRQCAGALAQTPRKTLQLFLQKRNASRVEDRECRTGSQEEKLSALRGIQILMRELDRYSLSF